MGNPIELVRQLLVRGESDQQRVSRGLILGEAAGLKASGIEDVRVYEGMQGTLWRVRYGATYNTHPHTLVRTQWESKGVSLRIFDDGSTPWVKHAVDHNGWRDVETHDKNGRRLSIEERVKRAVERATLQPDDQYQENLYPIRRPLERSLERRIF